MGEAARPLLSVVVPVFNQASSIVANLRVISERIQAGLEPGESFEVVVVSDGSIDATEEELLSGQGGPFRVFHYDRNLGKGYAVKLGALEASGNWIGFVDADLDLDPADLTSYVHHAQERGLDFAIGSKRHPDSQVHYPKSRVAASWLFQQLVRVLFRLDVRDTQVGLKVFSREVAEQVLPLLLVKRYAFDIELLAVSRAFGFGRVEEMPISLDYRFTGSQVRSRAVLRALVDTAAIFYRLRILRYYQRRRAISGAYGWTRPRAHRPLVSVILSDAHGFRDREYPTIEILETEGTLGSLREAALRANGEVLAILQPNRRAAGNWLSATVPYLARPEVTAVVVPKMAPLAGPVRARAAAAVDESRIGTGRGYFRYTPGNVRYVDEFPGDSLIVRREAFLALAPDIEIDDVVSHLAARGGSVLYTPDSVVIAEPPQLVGPHLRAVFGRGNARGRAVRTGRASLRVAVVPLLGVLLVVGVTVAALTARGVWTDLLIAIAALYALATVAAAAAAALRHQSLAVGALVAGAIPCTHAAYVAGLIQGCAD
jgi:glycosyltransferase involved in cell wall biosynthesis